MRSNVRMIKLTTCMSLLLAAVTYISSIKGMWGVDELRWLPDTFLLAVFGGAFAGMLVALICEISKYNQNRELMETFIFFKLYYLYGYLYIILVNINFFIKSIDPVPEKALVQKIADAEGEMNSILYADYAPFLKHNKFYSEKLTYNNNLSVISSFLQNCRMLEIAVLTDRQNSLYRGMSNETDTPDNVSLVLAKLSEQIGEPLSLVDGLLTRMDQICHDRYNWQQMRDDLIKRMPENQTNLLEQFLGEK